MNEETNYQQKERYLAIIPSGKYLMGVCSAFGNYIKVSPVFIRIIVLIFFYFLGQPVLLIYSAFGVLLPVSENNFSHNKINFNKITTNLLLISAIVLLILINNSVLTIKEIFDFISQKIDSFTLLLFSIALIINSHTKKELDMQNETPKELRKSTNKIIYGICGGFAEYLNVPANLVRLIWIIFFFATFGMAAIIYFVLNFIIPEKQDKFRNE